MSRPVTSRLFALATSTLVVMGGSAAVGATTASAAPGHVSRQAVVTHQVKLSIKLKGVQKGDVLRLQTPHGKSWLTLATTHIDGHGAGGFTVTAPETRKLRFYLEATKKHKSAKFAVNPAELT